MGRCSKNKIKKNNISINTVPLFPNPTHGLTNGLVVLDHLVKRGREGSSSNLEQVRPRQRVVGVAVANTMDKRE
ncbi:hypothetical protein SERLA73DRAFT_192196, partial [Serpula lacrymans var. lacrymans S7.3]